MSDSQKYAFEIRTAKNYQDENSPYTLARHEFLAVNIEQAEKYKKTLEDHYRKNKPCKVSLPWQSTVLKEIV